jgi:putative ubiquitin-RnfH superfamily antitoxin RatB of RatAB toxin-antitoxin module
MVPAEIAIEVVYAAGPHDVRMATLSMPLNATVLDAIRQSRLLEGVDAAQIDALKPAIWGHAAAFDAHLREGDRVELTRGLLVDPKEARRQRYRRDGVRRKAKVSGNPR